MYLGKRFFAEAIGALGLVFGGCGSAIYAAGIPASRLRPPSLL